MKRRDKGLEPRRYGNHSGHELQYTEEGVPTCGLPSLSEEPEKKKKALRTNSKNDIVRHWEWEGALKIEAGGIGQGLRRGGGGGLWVRDPEGAVEKWEKKKREIRSSGPKGWKTRKGLGKTDMGRNS